MIAVKFFTIFFFAFLLPGFLLTLRFHYKERLDFLFLVLLTVVWGTFSQLTSGLLSSLIPFWVAAVSVLAAVFWITSAYKPSWWKTNLKRIGFSFYDLLVAAVIITLFALTYSNINALPQKYLNTSSDQYRWMALATYLNENPGEVLISQLIKPFYRKGSILFLAPYALAFDRTLQTFQQLIFIWTHIFYALWIIAFAQLAKRFLSNKYLGLLALLVPFIFYWAPYYLSFAGIVPQNLAIPLLVAGLLIISDIKSKKLPVSLFTLFVVLFLVHIFTLIFLISTTLVAACLYGLKKIADKLPKTAVIWLAAAVTLLLIGYFFQSQGAWGHPYDDTIQKIALWLAFSGLITLVITKRTWAAFALAGGFLVVAVSLNFPELVEFLLPVKPQLFRYFIFSYPFLSFLAILPLDIAISQVRKLSLDLSAGLTFTILLIFVPTLLKEIQNQQSLVFSDMFVGQNKEGTLRKKALLELLDKRNLLKGNQPVLYSSGNKLISSDLVLWIFAPRPVYFQENDAITDYLGRKGAINEDFAAIQ